MTEFNYPHFNTASGYMTESIRHKFITHAISNGLLPAQAHRMPHIVSLVAPGDASQPIQFWQLYSVLGQERIVKMVRNFYSRVFKDEPWFSSVFSRIAGLDHHVRTQSSMWIDVMGGGMAYHGGEYRLSFHHTHNAIELMTDKGAERWAALMVATLDDPAIDMTADPRVRPSVNTFLTFFFDKYASEFQLGHRALFGDTNPPVKRRINFLNMTEDAIAALTEKELTDALNARGIDTSQLQDKRSLVNKAASL